MNPADHPIIRSYWRMQWRSGAWVLPVLALLLGILILAIMMESVPEHASDRSAQKVAENALGGFASLSALVLLLFALRPVIRKVNAELKSGLLEANRLTPMTPRKLAVGYLIGPGVMGIAAYVVLLALSLAIVILLPISFMVWLQIVLLLTTTGILVGLAALLAGVAGKSNRAAAWMLGLICILWAGVVGFGKRFIGLYLLPFEPVSDLVGRQASRDIAFFATDLHPLLLVLPLQAVVGGILWRAIVIRLSDPQRPLLTWPVAMVGYVAAILVQAGLSWQHENANNLLALQAYIFICLLLLGAPLCLGVERVRVEVIGKGYGLGRVLLGSGPALALAMAVMGAIMLGAQLGQVKSLVELAAPVMIAELLILGVGVFMLVEIIRLLWPKRERAIWMVVLAVLVVLPVGLALLFQDRDILVFWPFFTSAVAMLPKLEGDAYLQHALWLHGGLLLGLTVVWVRLWARVVRQAQQG